MATAPISPGLALGFQALHEGLAGRVVFAAADPAAGSLTPRDLSRLCRSGHLVRLARGRYRIRETTASPSEIHGQLARLVLSQRRDVVASHHTALVLHGLPTWWPNLDEVHVMRRRGGRWSQCGGVVTHAADASMHPKNTVEPNADASAPASVSDAGTDASADALGDPSIRFPQMVACTWLAEAGPVRACTVPVAHALIQTGMMSGPFGFLVPADAALRQRKVTAAEIAEAAASYEGGRGTSALFPVLSWADPTSESPYETVARCVLRQLGFHPETQYAREIGGHRFRADLALPEHRLLIEIDGAEKYNGDDSSEVVMAEKDRQEALELDGWRVVRFTPKQIAERERVHLGRMRARLEVALNGNSAGGASDESVLESATTCSADMLSIGPACSRR